MQFYPVFRFRVFMQGVFAVSLRVKSFNHSYFIQYAQRRKALMAGGIFVTLREKYSGVLVGVLTAMLVAFLVSLVWTSGFFGNEIPKEYQYIGAVGEQDIAPDYVKMRSDRDIYFQEITGQITGQLNDFQRQQIYSQTWNRLVQELVLEKEYERLGLGVSDAEYKEAAFGTNPDPIVTALFGGTETLRNLLKQKDKDTRTRFILSYFENDIFIPNRKRTKYESLLRNGVFVSKAQAKYKHQEENERRDIQFFGVSFAAVADSLVAGNLTESDLRNYYNEHQEEYRQNRPEAEIKLCQLPKTPTAADSARAFKQVQELIAELRTSKDDSIFAASYRSLSESYEPSVYQNRNQLDPAIKSRIENVRKDSVVGPFLDRGAWKIIKVSDVSNSEDRAFYKLRLIFLRNQGQTSADSLGLLFRAQNIRKLIDGGKKFDDVARDSSQDQQSAQSGGDVGWYTKGKYGPEVDKALKGARAGSVVGPVMAPQGAYILKIEEKSTDGIRLATVASDIIASEATITALTAKADQLLADIAKDPSKFDDLCKAAGLMPQPQTSVNPESRFVAGLMNSSDVKQVLRWALGGKTGDLMDNSLNLERAIVIGMIVSKSDKGYKPFEAVKESIRPLVINEKKAKLIVAKLGNTTGKTPEALKGAYGLGAFVAEEKGLAFSASAVQGVPRPSVIGTAFGLKLGATSQPIIEKDGVFVVKVNQVTPATALEGQQLEDYRKNLQATRRSQYINQVLQGLTEVAEIKDYRYNHEF
jgi:parvulin-like peptidyl-prolyl isomerase